MIGIGIYHAVDLRANARLLPPLVDAVAEITGGQRLTYVEGMLAESGRPSREMQLSAKNLSQLEADVAAGRYESLEFNEHRRSARESGLEGVSFHLGVVPDDRSGEQVACPFSAKVLLPDAAARSVGALLFGTRELLRDLGGEYAFIYPGADFRDVFMELSGVPIFPWNQVLTEEEEERKERLTAAQRARAQIGAQVRGAYWGNFLGPRIVADLGGLERVRAEAPVAVVQPFGAGGAYLQLTENPDDWRSADYSGRLAMLQRYLKAVTI